VSDCPRCGAVDAGEEYCLTCGTRLRAQAPDARLHGGSPATVLGVVLTET